MATVHNLISLDSAVYIDLKITLFGINCGVSTIANMMVSAPGSVCLIPARPPFLFSVNFPQDFQLFGGIDAVWLMKGEGRALILSSF